MSHPPEFRLYRSKARRAFFFRYKDARGLWQSKAVPVSVQKEHEAQPWAQAWMGDRATPAERVRPTFKQVSALWLKRREEADDPKALSSARTFTARWLGELSDVQLECCGIGDASRWVEWVRSRCSSPYTARNIVSCMRGMVVEARGMGWVELRENVFADPWIRKVLGATTPPGAIIVRLEKGELQRLLACRLIEHQRRKRYLLASTTALRLGEIAALRQRDLAGGIVDVHRQLTSGRFKPPKRGSSRLLPVHPRLVALFSGGEPSSPLLASHDCGNWSRELREDLAVAGLSPRHRSGSNFTFHALRRTALTVMRASGMPLEDVKAVAGHCGRSVTERHYASADLERLKAAITAAFDDVLRDCDLAKGPDVLSMETSVPPP